MTFDTGEQAFSHAKHRARYAHEDMVVSRRGERWCAERVTATAIKAAMLAVGTAGKFYVVSGRIPFVVGWREAVTRFRNARFAEGGRIQKAERT